VKTSWSALAGLAKVAYPKANPGFRDEGRNRVPAIVKINKVRERLACEFNAYGSRGYILNIISDFEPAVETVYF